MKPERLVLIEWLERAKAAKPGEVVYVHCEDKHRQKALTAGFREELAILAKISPTKAASITVVPLFKDRMHWVALKKSGADPEVGFLKDEDGNIKRIAVPHKSLLDQRVARQMAEDGICTGVIEYIPSED